jgi:dihydrodipicolinate synthase/N-acetylneuraminate lyase
MAIYHNCDAILILPWWFGSLYEFFTANYCKICDEIKIPVVLYNSCWYYDKLISFIYDAENLNFIRIKERWNYYIANNVIEAMEYLKI